MELRELAERILFATSLEEKFLSPESVTDERPGPALPAPPLPGRPPGLRFKESGKPGLEAPVPRHLEREGDRGRFLHVFANHELLATELMALVLLRFPEAPRAFRRGVWQTLRDEQIHTRLYLERLRDCGVEFGEWPVSGYFWRAIAGMTDPMDYVAGLSLTFEQANLDFSREFARAFARVGDDDSARLLDRIYRDEIAHVAYGLKWFRRWKSPGESDWDAYRRTLRFPLSPRRAKGPTVNVEGRLAAGFDPTFIAELEVCAQSKGRTPSVLVFNPFAEARLARGPGFTPRDHQRQLALDLASLPQFLGRQDDVVLVPQRPSATFLASLQHAGFPLPEFVELHHGRLDPEQPLCRRKLRGLRPWAWGPDSLELLAPLLDAVHSGATAPPVPDPAAMGRLYSKAWSAHLLREVLASTPEEPWLSRPEDVGIVATSVDAALAAVAAIRRRGHHPVVLKEALGLAGHNAIRLLEPDWLDSQVRWIERVTEGGRALLVEPWLDRCLDFSVHLDLEPAGLKLRGYSGLLNDERGQYRANWAAPDHRRCPPFQLRALFPEVRDGVARIAAWYAEHLFPKLEHALRAEGYHGPVGIDALVHRTPDGGHRLKPVVEINPRHTMGRLTLELMRPVRPGRYGVFRILPRARVRAAGFEEFTELARSLTATHPIRLHGEPDPRLDSGSLCLNDPEAAVAALALFHVGSSLAELNALHPSPGLP